MTKIEPRLLKGFRDYSPNEQLARQAMFSSIQSVFEQFGFLPLSTPVLEYKDILMGKYGDDQKLVYTFKDHGDRDVAMRYDLTVPMARYVAQNQGQLAYPFKRYQIAPVWRADNPQKGRLREFYQCDVDAVGTDAPLADAEVIACLCKALESIGITKYRVKINDRRIFGRFNLPEEQKDEVIRSIDKYPKIGWEGVEKDLRVKELDDSTIAAVKDFLEKAFGPNPMQIFSEIDEVGNDLKNLIGLIIGFGVNKENLELDFSIARGLDYYSSTVFETVLLDKPEYGSICSGGRYDNLIDQFSNQSLSAVGGSIGIDRLLGAMEELGLSRAVPAVTAIVLNQSENLTTEYIKLVTMLRVAGVSAEVYYANTKLDKQFKYAESKEIPYAIIIGEAEVAKGVAQLKDLRTRHQEELPIADIIKRLIQHQEINR